jgi:hypothetical protein
MKRTGVKPMIKPERSGGSILDFNSRDGPKGVQLVADDVPKVVARLWGERERGRGIEYPVFPGGVLVGEEFADEFHEQASVLEFETLHSKATPVFGSLYKIPSHKTFRSMACIFSGPKESPPAFINRFDYSFGDANRRHEVEGYSTKNRVAKSETAGPVKKGSLPSRQVPITRGDLGKTIRNRNFMWAERKPKVGPREARGGGTTRVFTKQGAVIFHIP